MIRTKGFDHLMIAYTAGVHRRSLLVILQYISPKLTRLGEFRGKGSAFMDCDSCCYSDCCIWHSFIKGWVMPLRLGWLWFGFWVASLDKGEPHEVELKQDKHHDVCQSGIATTNGDIQKYIDQMPYNSSTKALNIGLPL